PGAGRGNVGDFLDAEIIRLLFQFHTREWKEVHQEGEKVRPREVEPKTVAQSALNPANLSVSSVVGKFPYPPIIVARSKSNARGNMKKNSQSAINPPGCPPANFSSPG